MTDYSATPAAASVTAQNEVLKFNRSGLFLGGCPKSGTTLLLSLLDSHPQLVVLPEETFYLEHRRHYQKLTTYEEKLTRLLTKTDIRLLGSGVYKPRSEADSADIRDYTGFDYQKFSALAAEFVRSSGINDSLLFTEVIRAYAITVGADWTHCVRWIEKSTSNETHPEVLNELYPDAKLVQLLRDPRAVFASRKKRQVRNGALYRKAHRLLREWNRCARHILRLRKDSEKNLVMRYEDLVKDPEKIIKQLCQFIGIEFVPAMLRPTRAGGKWEGNSSFKDTFSGIDPASADAWKDYLTEHEIWWVELHCRKGMERAGYPLLTGGNFSLARWMKRLPGESWEGYFRARRGSLCQWLGLLKECNYPPA